MCDRFNILYYIIIYYTVIGIGMAVRVITNNLSIIMVNS